MILELNTYSLEELENVDKAFTYRYITLPIEEWSDLILQTSSTIILRADETSSEADLMRIKEEVNNGESDIMFELKLSSLDSLNNYSKILPQAFISFTNFSDTIQLIKDQKIFPHGISIGEEAEEDGLLDYEQIDQFIEILDGLYEHP